MAIEPLAQVEAAIPDPTRGLPEEVFLFLTRVTPMVNVDLLIRDGDRTLLTWRDDGYYPASWHVPGGVIRFKETFADRIRAVARLELGATVRFDPAALAINEVIHPTRKNRGHFISLLYACELESPPDPALAWKSGDPQPGQWAWLPADVGPLIEVHEIYRGYFAGGGRA